MLFSPSHARLPLPVLLNKAEAAAAGRDTTLFYYSLRVIVIIAVARELGIGRGVEGDCAERGDGKEEGRVVVGAR